MSATMTQFDHYALETGSSGEPRALSADGTGATYRAYDQRSRQAVLLRIFSDKLLADAAVQREFVRNARWLIELDHPRVTRIIDTGNFGEQFYYVLENPGGELVEESVASSGPLGVDHALTLQLQLSEVLIAVRSHPGLLSRVWPRNLMAGGQGLTPSIHVIAQNLIAAIDPVEQPEYLAPEILAGHSESEQSMLYSVGATLFFMLSGKPPYPAYLPPDDLLEIKFQHLPDMGLLPPGAPYPLLRQLLAPEPGNRPQSIEAWDRALRRFLQFTPAATGSVHEQSGAVSTAEPAPVPTPLTPFRVAAPSAVGPSMVPAGTALDGRDELQQAKEHTQRLSLELTKRVQKELALTEQLERLEEELGQERARVRELTSRHQIKPGEEERTHLKTEKTKIDEEWAAILAARKKLEREKSDFLKRTQRFSISQLKSELEPSGEPAASQQPAAKSRFFRFGKKEKSTWHKAAAILNRESKPSSNDATELRGEAPAKKTTLKGIEMREREAPGAVPQKPGDRVAVEPPPEAPEPDEKPGVTSPAESKGDSEPQGDRVEGTSGSPEPAGEKAVAEHPPAAASPMAKPDVEALDPDGSGAAAAPVVRQPAGDGKEPGVREDPKPARRVELPLVMKDDKGAKTEPEPAKGTGRVTSVTPFILSKPASASALGKTSEPVLVRPSSASSKMAAAPPPQPAPGANLAVPGTSQAPAARGKQPLALAKGPHERLPEVGSPAAILLKPAVRRPVYEPLPGAWAALVILGLAIVLGLYLAYRTFFAMEDGGQFGAANSNVPVVVDLFEPAEEVEEVEGLTAEDANQPSEQGAVISETEAQVNEELRVDMRAFENFLLLQDEAWKELLGGMQRLEQEEAAYSAEELRQIRQELLEDLERKVQLSKDGHLRENADFGEVYDYLKGVLDAGKGNAAVEKTGAIE